MRSVTKSDRRQHGRFVSRRIQTKKEWQELRKGARGYIICADCGAVYWKKSWHHGLDAPGAHGAEKKVSFKFCPACRMIRDRQFEGEVILEGVPEKYRMELVAHLRNVGETARRLDPMDRIIAIQSRDSRIRITTTENRLALRLGREAKQLLGNRGARSVRFSKEEDIVRVWWQARFDESKTRRATKE